MKTGLTVITFLPKNIYDNIRFTYICVASSSSSCCWLANTNCLAPARACAPNYKRARGARRGLPRRPKTNERLDGRCSKERSAGVFTHTLTLLIHGQLFINKRYFMEAYSVYWTILDSFSCLRRKGIFHYHYLILLSNKCCIGIIAMRSFILYIFFYFLFYFVFNIII